MELFYRILEEYYKINIYCLSMMKDTVVEMPRHRFYHCRPKRAYRECMVLYRSTSTSGNRLYNLVVSNSVISSDKETRGCMPKSMSVLCHNLLVNSHNITMIKNRDVYVDALSDVDYLKQFSRFLRAVSVDGAGKAEFLVLGVPDAISDETKALCCVKCLQVQAPNTSLWEAPPVRISTRLAVRIFGEPKGESYDGIVYDGYGVENGFVVYTKDCVLGNVDLPVTALVEDSKLTAEALWIVVKRAYALYRATKSGSPHGWVEFQDRYLLVVDASNVAMAIGSTQSVSNPRRRITTGEYNRLVHCLESIPDYVTLKDFIQVVSRVTTDLTLGGKITLTEREIECVGMYASKGRDPVGLTIEGKSMKIPDNVISFESRELPSHQSDMERHVFGVSSQSVRADAHKGGL